MKVVLRDMYHNLMVNTLPALELLHLLFSSFEFGAGSCPQ